MKKSISNNSLVQDIKILIEEARKSVVRNINTTMLLTHFEIGRMIVEEEQQGKEKAEYGKELIKHLSEELTKEFGKGYSQRNIFYFRQFFLTYEQRILQSLIAKSTKESKTQSLIAKLELTKTNSEEAANALRIFELSWTHHLLLMKVEKEEERNFYEIEAISQNWSVRELERQYHSSLYERLALSRDKEGVKELAKKGQIVEKTLDIIKDPFVLEFLDLKEDNRYSELDLETAIINKLEHFMLELGKGFLFAGRQKRITLERDHFFVDLVFYNRLLRCFVLIDLKIGKLTHQDIGQMQMYVNYYDRTQKTKDENPTIGIVLCKENKKAVVEFTLPENNTQIFASEYKDLLPSKEDFKKQLE
ncbi:MAG: PDDEXK nuclease domain-containing protein [Bacteroidota bacterium]|nr:PDDEXK nuclease domain-containing protein [Bacteroidota bacterium]